MRMGRPSKLVGIAIAVALGCFVSLVGAQDNDAFDLEHASTPTEAREHCIAVLSQCRTQCGTMPTTESSEFGPWEACLARCNAREAKCQAAVKATWADD